jgi:hypothetical protein
VTKEVDQLAFEARLLDGKQKQLRRRYATVAEAREELAEIIGQLGQGHVRPAEQVDDPTRQLRMA